MIRPKIGIDLGGAENHAAQVAIKLLERGHKVSLLAHTVSFPERILKNLDLHYIKFKGFGSVIKQLLFIKQAKKILSSLKGYYRIISFFRIPYPTDLYILCDPLIAFFLEQRRPFLYSIRPRYLTLLHLEKEALKQASKAISIFSLGKELIKRLYPNYYTKTFICYRGIDKERFSPVLKAQKEKLRADLSLSKRDYLLLFVGYDTKRKGLDLLLRILPNLPSHIKLLVAGKDGTSSERIKFLGKVKEMEKLYALSDLFVLPTLYDPGAQSTLEALASGTPVITTPFDGTSEFVIEGLNGFVVEREEKALKEAILRALDTPFDPYIIASTVAHLTWDNYVDCLINHLEE